ncbi:hypothetical protein HY251_09005 [bacterium]|nr:hypothetical protein [bacterium]
MRRHAFAKILVAAFFGATIVPAAARAQDGEKPKTDQPKPDQPKPDQPKPDQPAPRRPDGGGGRGPGGGMGRMLEQAKDELGLSDEQMQKVRDLMGDMGETMRKIFEESQGDRDKLREKMQEHRDKMIGKVKEILTKEQGEKLDKYMADRPGGMGGFGGGGFGGGRMGGGGPSPEERAKRQADRAESILVLSQEEKGAVMPLVKKLLELRKTGTSELATKLSEHKKVSTDEKKKLDEAQAAVRDLLTVDNEARLVAIGILD